MTQGYPIPPTLDYGFRSAGELATGSVPVASGGMSAAEVPALLGAHELVIADEIVLCRDGRYEGLVPVERVLTAEEGERLRTLVDDTVPVVRPDETAEISAWQMVHHQAHVVVVVDVDGTFCGLIPAARIAEVLVREHEQDLAHLSGFLHDSSVARLASTETIARRLWHRLPWLLIGLAGAFLAASIVSGFETSLEANVELAFFLPGIVYLADAVGTQTETLMVRGLSVGVSVRQVIRRELLTGLSLGLLLGLVAFPFSAALFVSTDVALVVSLALFSASAIATAIAMLLPYLFNRYGVDPAFGSGPLATVIQDLLSIVIYFGFAAAIL